MFLSRPLLPLLLLSLTSLPALAADDGHDHHGNHPPHVHGVGKLDVALEGNTLTLHLDSPLINLVGFEHAANSAKDKDTVRAAAQSLRDVGRMFATDASAQCKPAEVQLESAVLTPALLGEKAPASSEAAPTDGHADLDGDFTLVCASPGALNTIDVSGLFAAFPGFHRIDVQMATPKKQGAAQLVPGSAVIPLN
ncbi:hypothetical protein RB25_25495 [Herbaspirillum rubrisubalbicans]|jgi:hypothetical protein|uniref:DUF2796 domain-containing protein n=1 Tax=Herbaspirillum rubrisubalbicans TaxID=80842 RepID=A0AAD0UBI9_9BURK|nr:MULTISPECIES: DUF2796 domain-containing protein [Herbaspirillum]ALU90347.1 hypothetical protein Hrubri_3186 [Herbaspirillum rubrisubalbicans M1]AYR25377.1 DUF2796 domain-containing protein [Herbaspirillum rubrisubalbicans]MCP1573552.1 hypothetical protein [Herbaspirillum rubrisubalbicans]RAM61438.1 hypothetical protein RB24_25275 [Herbaspirillum rubrisubalbicans]RAN42642.1 hypothetical protein RB25_25495 [Herbaspirillum rubrisubalbicans]